MNLALTSSFSVHHGLRKGDFVHPEGSGNDLAHIGHVTVLGTTRFYRMNWRHASFERIVPEKSTIGNWVLGMAVSTNLP